MYFFNDMERFEAMLPKDIVITDPKITFEDMINRYALTDQEKEALRLRFVSNMTFEAIADEMSMTSRGYAERFIARTLDKLKRRMTT